jgi:hypothetical protein
VKPIHGRAAEVPSQMASVNFEDFEVPGPAWGRERSFVSLAEPEQCETEGGDGCDGSDLRVAIAQGQAAGAGYQKPRFGFRRVAPFVAFTVRQGDQCSEGDGVDVGKILKFECGEGINGSLQLGDSLCQTPRQIALLGRAGVFGVLGAALFVCRPMLGILLSPHERAEVGTNAIT